MYSEAGGRRFHRNVGTYLFNYMYSVTKDRNSPVEQTWVYNYLEISKADSLPEILEKRVQNTRARTICEPIV
jgi:hypothetical protein